MVFQDCIELNMTIKFIQVDELNMMDETEKSDTDLPWHKALLQEAKENCSILKTF